MSRPIVRFCVAVAAFVAVAVLLRQIPGVPPIAADAAAFLVLALLLKPLVARHTRSAAWAASAAGATAMFVAIEWLVQRVI